MIVDLKFVTKCEILGLDESFKGSCFGNMLPQIVFCRNFKFVSINFAQLDLHKCITWPKKMEQCLFIF
jgi:hypothetical protein